MRGAGSGQGAEETGAEPMDKQAFIELMVRQGVLQFGEFLLKSGRRSPYFFNLGAVSEGAALAALGRCYADAIQDGGLGCKVLFGPAYKGIPIVVAAALAFAERGRRAEVAFNRKEAKDHGEGGALVGASLAGRQVLVLDDVITAGDAKQEAAQLVAAAGGELVGVVIAFDRRETLDDGATAAEHLQRKLEVPVISIASLEDAIGYLDAQAAASPSGASLASAVRAYRDAHCRLAE